MSFLTGSANCIKYTLFAFNLVFVLTGIILIAVGVAVAAVFGEYNLFLEPKFFSVTTLLIVIGSFIFVIAFFGCCGAYKENYYMILIFSVLLSIIFILELAAGISGYVLRSDCEELISKKLSSTLDQYTKDMNIANIWDITQREFTCCGVKDYTSWQESLTNNEVPLSCCNIPSGVVGEFSCFGINSNRFLNGEGCLTEFSNYISSHAVSLGAAGVIIAIIQFFGVFFACYIAREIKIRDGISGFM